MNEEIPESTWKNVPSNLQQDSLKGNDFFLGVDSERLELCVSGENPDRPVGPISLNFSAVAVDAVNYDYNRIDSA